MSTRRVEEVAALLKREISMLMHETLAEEYGLVTLTDIKVTADFKESEVFISVFDKDKEVSVLDKLEEVKPKYQRILGKKLRMKFTPKINFKIDQMQEKVDKVDKLLWEIKNGA
jgi:ribosome-binding factor A